jgi:putative endonuclease
MTPLMVTVYVYILRCADGSYYAGKYQGDRLEWRIADHNSGICPNAYAAKRRPVTLVWSTWFGRYDEAVSFERRLKGWSRAKKEALMRGDEAALKSLSKRRSSSLPPEEPERSEGITKGEEMKTGARILRDAAEGAAPQDEDICLK